MALASAGCNPELREVRLRDKPAEMIEVSPKATVPVLQLDTGEVHDESLLIMGWALSNHDPDQWLRNRDNEQLTNMLETNDGPFKTALDRYKYPNRFSDADAALEHDKAATCLAPLDEKLKGQSFLDGDTPGFFDAAIFPFVRQFSAVDSEAFAGLPYAGLARWREAMLQHSVFTRVMKKLNPWHSGDSPLAFQESLVPMAVDN
jgi:glutathione S-transferase